MLHIRYSRNLSDICLVMLYRDTYKGRKLVKREPMARVEYMRGESVKIARKIVAALNKTVKGYRRSADSWQWKKKQRKT